MGGRLLFMLTLWMAISVALLSALTPLGPPSSKTMGSAFNPATTAVVLKARAQLIPSDERLSVADGNGGAPSITPIMQWVIFAAATVLLACLLRPLTTVVPAISPRMRRRVPRRFHARAPPVLT